jgi:PhoH-like ATPase
MSDPQRKIFVLDTSVILYDFNALQNFHEHDVAIPITVLEELDHFKKGNSVLNLQAREFIRQLDKLSSNNMLHEWIPLDGPARGKFRVVTSEGSEGAEGNERGSVDAGEVFGSRKADHRILNAALHLTRAHPERRVILVSKDVNLRLKARALNLPAEDYETVKIKDLDHLPKGKNEVDVADGSTIDRLYQEEWLPVESVLEERPPGNQYFILRSGSKSALAYYNPRNDRIERVVKPIAYGISPRNAEQTFALHAVLNLDVPLVTLSGAAGTGKTLLALAGALDRAPLQPRHRLPAGGRQLQDQPLHAAALGQPGDHQEPVRREGAGVQEGRRDGRDREAPHRAPRLHPRPQPVERDLHRGRGPEPHPS